VSAEEEFNITKLQVSGQAGMRERVAWPAPWLPLPQPRADPLSASLPCALRRGQLGLLDSTSRLF
jgi:hypothetical protein